MIRNLLVFVSWLGGVWFAYFTQEVHETKPWQRISAMHLPNLLRVGDHLYSGGQPEGEAAFRELRDLGVRTLVSVDGAQPNGALAKQFGLRYVHLPHGYDGIREETVGALAKAIQDLPVPIYLHCHHGKHRSPAALAAACVARGLLTPNEGKTFLMEAGTSPSYQGLYRTVEKTPTWSDEKLRNLRVEFREKAAVPALAKAMVELEKTFDHLQKIQGNRWKPLPADPDLDFGHEALLLEEHFREMGRLPRVRSFPEAFTKELKLSETTCVKLQESWQRWKGEEFAGQPPPELAGNLRVLQAGCVNCHRKFRDASQD